MTAHREFAVAGPFGAVTALVTGAGRGIGREVALGLARLGAEVAVLARSRDEVEETAGLIVDAGGKALAVPADVADPEAREAALHSVRMAFGDIGVLVNNAAVVSPLGPSTRISVAEWNAAIGINVTAVAALTFAVLPDMLGQGWGRVVNVSSGVVDRPGSMIGGNAYVTTKAALEAHSVNLAAELAGTGVTVNVYRPGSVDTAMQEWIRGRDQRDIPEIHERFQDNYRQGRLVSPAASAAGLLAHLSGSDTGRIWELGQERAMS